MSVKEPHIIKTETILSVAIFGHGIEQQHGLEKNDPWLEKSGNHPIPPEYRTEIPEFYKNRVRVFSYSGMPDIQCIYAEQGISLMAENLAMVLRSNPNAETKTAL
jgi:hypothetical protein